MKIILISVTALGLFSFDAKSQINAVITANSTNVCQGMQATMTANPSGGSYSHQWLLNNFPINGAVSVAYSTMVGGDFSCIVTDGVYTDTSNVITITVNPNPVVSLPPNTTVCAGNTVQLCANGGLSTYQWSNGANTQCINVSTAGAYSITVTDQNGCTASASTVVTVIPLPSALISGNANICIGDQANLTVSFTGTPPFIYSYTNGVTTFGPFTTSNNLTVITVSPLSTTTYSLTGVSNMCIGTVSGVAIITVNPLPFVAANSTGPLTFCTGDSVLLTALSNSVTYQWYRYSHPIPGATSQNYYAKRTGDFMCIVTSLAAGCVSNPSFPPIHVSVPCVPLDPPDLKLITPGEEVESSTFVTHDIAEINEEVSAYFLFNTVGEMVEQGIASSKKIELNFEDRNPGIYFLRLVLKNNEVITRRILKN